MGFFVFFHQPIQTSLGRGKGWPTQGTIPPPFLLVRAWSDCPPMDRPAHFDVRQARPPVLGILSEHALQAVQQRVEAKLGKAAGLLAR